MNILIFNWRDPKNPKAGGAEAVTMQHAKEWAKKGHNVTWFTSAFPNSLKQEVTDGVNIIRKGNSLGVYMHAPFYYFFGGEKFDLVIDEIHGLPFFTPLYVRKAKIAFIHEVAQEIWDYMYPFPLNIFGRVFESIYFKLYKNIPFWTDAPSTIDDLVKFGINRKLCKAIPCPIENKTLDRLPVKEDIPTFIFVSRIVKMKGIEEVIKAFSYIKTEEKNARLWIVGGGEKGYVMGLKKMVSDLGIAKNVIFFGITSNQKKLELMRKAHLLIHASVREGWGLVVLEGSSQGTPTVAYNVSGLKDSVQNGKTGIIVSQNLPKELAKEALLLLNNKEKYRLFQVNGLSWVKSLTWEDVTKRSLQLLERVKAL